MKNINYKSKLDIGKMNIQKRDIKKIDMITTIASPRLTKLGSDKRLSKDAKILIKDTNQT